MVVSDELIIQCRKGDRRAQNELYKLCYTHLIAVCWRYASSKEEAVEFMNLGFVKIVTNLEKKKAEVPFELWARRITINVIIDEYRKQKNYQRHYQLHEQPEKLGMKDTDEQEDKEYELVDLIKSKIPQLPPMTAKVFNLYAIDGFKHQEIANMLEISEGTSMWHYSEAKRRIRELLKTEKQEF